MERLIKKLELMKHAIGFENRKITSSRHFKSYRNYFYVREEDAMWEELVKDDLATKRASEESVYYHVTEKGIKMMERVFDFKYKEMD